MVLTITNKNTFDAASKLARSLEKSRTSGNLSESTYSLSSNNIIITNYYAGKLLHGQVLQKLPKT